MGLPRRVSSGVSAVPAVPHPCGIFHITGLFFLFWPLRRLASSFLLNTPSMMSSVDGMSSKIPVMNPVVELDGDEMTRIIWKKIREEVCPPPPFFVFVFAASLQMEIDSPRALFFFSPRTKNCSLSFRTSNWISNTTIWDWNTGTRFDHSHSVKTLFSFLC